MRILIANETYPPDINGAARFTENLARGLASRGHHVAVIAPGTKFKDEIEEESPNLEIFRIRSVSLKTNTSLF